MAPGRQSKFHTPLVALKLLVWMAVTIVLCILLYNIVQALVPGSG